jgi:hypothetical protein
LLSAIVATLANLSAGRPKNVVSETTFSPPPVSLAEVGTITFEATEGVGGGVAALYQGYIVTLPLSARVLVAVVPLIKRVGQKKGISEIPLIDPRRRPPAARFGVDVCHSPTQPPNRVYVLLGGLAAIKPRRPH